MHTHAPIHTHGINFFPSAGGFVWESDCIIFAGPSAGLANPFHNRGLGHCPMEMHKPFFDSSVCFHSNRNQLLLNSRLGKVTTIHRLAEIYKEVLVRWTL